MYKLSSHESYRAGYSAGRADRLLGLDPSIIARTSPWGWYSQGYIDAYNGKEAR
jgi:hypothetical protein